MNFILVCVIQPNETFLSNNRKLFWFENSRMLIAVFKKCCVIYYNFRYTFVICEAYIARSVVCVRVCTDSLIGGDVSFCQMTLDTLFSSEM